MKSITKHSLILFLIMVVAHAAVGQADYKGVAITKDILKKAVDAVAKESTTAKRKKAQQDLLNGILSYGVDFDLTPAIEAEFRSAKVPQEVILAAKENLRLSNGKRASFLTITANFADAQIVIDGERSFTGGVSGYPIPPGIYTVTARKSGYSPQSQTVEIRGPATRSSIKFELKEMPVNELLAEAKAALQRGDHRAVRDLCKRVSLKDASNVTADILLGKSYYMTREFDQALEYLLRGIKAGESVKFKMGRRDGARTEFGILKLTATKITFINQKAALESQVTDSEVGDTDAGFDVPFAKILLTKLNNVRDGWRIELDVDISKTKKVNKKDFDLYLGPRGGAYDIFVCTNCQDELNLILDVIKRFSAGAK